MANKPKPIVSFEDTFGKLDIRVERVIEVELESRTHKPTYKMIIDRFF
jgi:tRNA-binding protein